MQLNIRYYQKYQHEQQFTIPADLLKSIIRETVFAVATSESRPVLTGVNWKIQDDELICVATDSHRLARRKTKLEQFTYRGIKSL